MSEEEKYESTVRILTVFLEDNEQYGDDWSEEKKGLNDLLAEVKRLRKRLEAFDCMRFDIEHAIDHSWASWEDLKVFLKEMIE
jgi:hypothetical protein